jgi:hypothetical protein
MLVFPVRYKSAYDGKRETAWFEDQLAAVAFAASMHVKVGSGIIVIGKDSEYSKRLISEFTKDWANKQEKL